MLLILDNMGHASVIMFLRDARVLPFSEKQIAWWVDFMKRFCERFCKWSLYIVVTDLFRKEEKLKKKENEDILIQFLDRWINIKGSMKSEVIGWF